MKNRVTAFAFAVFPSARAVAVVVALISLLHASFARSAPRSVYNGSTLAHASNTPNAVGAADMVSQQTGTFTYAFPIETPPGRMGLEPSLALSYRSDGAIYGGLAAGWSLDVPSIALMDSVQGGFLEIKGGSSALESTYQLRLQTYRSVVENTPLTIQTTRPVGIQFGQWLDRWGVSIQVPPGFP
jgi:hypothetical protein